MATRRRRLIFEVRGLPEAADSKKMGNYRGSGVGVIVQYENGHILIPSYTGATAYDKSGKEVMRWGSSKGDSPKGEEEKREGHYENFISAVRSRKHWTSVPTSKAATSPARFATRATSLIGSARRLRRNRSRSR